MVEQTAEQKRKEELNHQAYNDVVDCKEPTLPDDAYYMECYRSWRPLQKFPYDYDNDYRY